MGLHIQYRAARGRHHGIDLTVGVAGQLATGKIEHEMMSAIIAFGATDAGRGDLCGTRLDPGGRVRTPVQTIDELPLALFDQGFGGAPEGYQVIVALAVCRDLDQHHRAGAPIAYRFYPHAGTQFVARVEILVVGEIAIALHEAEALGIVIDEARNAQPLGIDHRSPQPLAGTGQHHEAIGVMHRWTKVIDLDPIVGGEEKHAGQRREADGGERGARIERQIDIDDGIDAGSDGESIGADHARSVEQRVDHHAVVIYRLLEVELTKGRELFVVTGGGAESDAARRYAVAHAAAESAKIARTEKRDQLVEIVRCVERGVDPEAGIAQGLGQRLGTQIGVTVVEQGG